MEVCLIVYMERHDLNALKKAHDEQKLLREKNYAFQKSLFPDGVLRAKPKPGFEKRFAKAVKNNQSVAKKLLRKSKAELIQMILDYKFFQGATRTALVKGLKFVKSSFDGKKNGKLGGKKIDAKKVDLANTIIKNFPPNKFESSSYRNLAEYLTLHSPHGITFKKDWVANHLKARITK